MSERHTRIQAAVIRGDALLVLDILLDNGTSFWLLPGGGAEPSDTDEAATGAVR